MNFSRIAFFSAALLTLLSLLAAQSKPFPNPIVLPKPKPNQLGYRYNLKTVLESAVQKPDRDTLSPVLTLSELQLGPNLYRDLTFALAKSTAPDKGLQVFIDRYYYEYRGFLKTMSDLEQKYPFRDANLWTHTEVQSGITNGTRHIYASKLSLFAALLDYKKNGDKLIYPVGTAFVSETFRSDSLKSSETKSEMKFVQAEVMIKRSDGEWDFFMYSEQRQLTLQPLKSARTGTSPRTCLTCHYNPDVRHEPFASFPNERAGKNIASVAVPDDLRGGERVFKFFAESQARADHIFGSYASLLVAGVKRDAAAGKLSLHDKFIYEKLKPLYPDLFAR